MPRNKLQAVVTAQSKKATKDQEVLEWATIMRFCKRNKAGRSRIYQLIQQDKLCVENDGEEATGPKGKKMHHGAVHNYEVPAKYVLVAMAVCAEGKNDSVTTVSLKRANVLCPESSHRVMYLCLEVGPEDKKLEKEYVVRKWHDVTVAHFNQVDNDMMKFVTFTEEGRLDWDLSGWFLRLEQQVYLDRKTGNKGPSTPRSRRTR
jgi:hypothetical protein